MMRDVHVSVIDYSDEFYEALGRKIYVTPKSYLDTMTLFFNLLGTKHSELTINRNRYTNGVNMLKKTNEDVEKMQVELTDLKPVLE